MASTQPVVKFTYEDYLATPDDERYELPDGDLIMVAARNLKHQRVSARLHTQMGRFIEDRALGTLLYAPCDVVLSDTDVVQPDLLFVSGTGTPAERRREGAGRTRSRGGDTVSVKRGQGPGAKRDLYGAHGVKEYWLVDPIAETISIHRQRGGVLTATHSFGRGQTLRSPLFADLELRLDDVFSS